MTINKDFRTKSDQELIEIVKKLRTKLLEYRFRNSTGEFQKPHQIAYARKSLAQALTILRERNVNIDHIQMEKLSDISKTHSEYFKASKDEESKKVSRETTDSNPSATLNNGDNK